MTSYLSSKQESIWAEALGSWCGRKLLFLEVGPEAQWPMGNGLTHVHQVQLGKKRSAGTVTCKKKKNLKHPKLIGAG